MVFFQGSGSAQVRVTHPQILGVLRRAATRFGLTTAPIAATGQSTWPVERPAQHPASITTVSYPPTTAPAAVGILGAKLLRDGNPTAPAT